MIMNECKQLVAALCLLQAPFIDSGIEYTMHVLTTCLPDCLHQNRDCFFLLYL